MTLQPENLTSNPLIQREVYRDQFTPNDWTAGLALHLEGQVVGYHTSDQNKCVEGKVRDVVEIFRVQLRFERLGFTGACSCRRPHTKLTCKHMAALLNHHCNPANTRKTTSPSENPLTPGDQSHLKQIKDAFEKTGTLHEVHVVKLQVLKQRCPQAVKKWFGTSWNAVESILNRPPTPNAISPTKTDSHKQTKDHIQNHASVRTTKNLDANAPWTPNWPSTRVDPGNPQLQGNPQQTMVFVLQTGKWDNKGPQPRIMPMWAQLDGETLVEMTPYRGQDRPPNNRLLQELLTLKAHQRLRKTPETDKLLESLLSSKTLYLQGTFHSPLVEGPARTGGVGWDRDSRGDQHAFFRTTPAARILPITSTWYVDSLTLQVGKVNTSLQNHHIEYFLKHPPVQPHQVDHARKAIRHLFGPDLPVPSVIPFEEVAAPLVPRLKISAVNWKLNGMVAPVPVAELTLSYLQRELHGKSIPNFSQKDPLPPMRIPTKDKLIIVQRDLASEQETMKTLLSMGFHPMQNQQGTLEYRYGKPGHFTPDHLWMHLMTMVIPSLQKQGWEVTIDPDFPFKVVKPSISGRLTEQDNWVEVDLGVEVEGRHVPLVPLLTAWMENNPDALYRLMETDQAQRVEFLPVGMNTYLQIELHRLKAILRLLVDFYHTPSSTGKFRIPRIAAPEFANPNEHNLIEWTGGEDLLALAKQLASLTSPPAPKIPRGLNATLRLYQQEGVAWLQILRETGCNGILADDMGLGKTLQTLTHLLIEKRAGRLTKPALVVAPTSLMGNWVAEATKFTPGLKTLLLHGPNRQKHFKDIAKADVVFTTYPLVHRDLEKLKNINFHTLILDEAQNIKNHKSQASQALSQLTGTHRLCLTGTPMENHLGELWSLFQFLMPGFLPKEQEFRQNYRIPIERLGNVEKLQFLSRMLRPLMLRRTKMQVAKELPPKTEILVTLPLNGQQRDVYETLRVAMQQKVQEEIAQHGLTGSQMYVLEALLKLRQACCDPRLLPYDEARKVTTSAKHQWFFETLPNMLEEGRSVLVFSQFASLLDLYSSTLNGLNIPHSMLTGETTNRQKHIERFQKGDTRVFLISLKAGGVGLNLTSADTVVHLDPWWNPASENQATDRAHRIGQTKPVFVYKLITEGTIEEKIVHLQQHKAHLAQSILEGSLGQGLKLSEEDLNHLLNA